MSTHSLLIKIPDNLYQILRETAQKTGQTPENLAVQWLLTGSQQTTDDPVEQFIGAFDSGGSDWLEQHDKYIGNSAIKSEQLPNE